MSGWCVADLFDLTARERMFSMIAASAADFDGLGIVFGQEYYAAYHHVLGHNLLFSAGLAALLAAFSTHRAKAFWLFLALFHLHLIMDYFGSGPGWGIYYLWPFSNREIENPYSWEFYSWQNFCAAGGFFLWTLAIVRKSARTPLELIMPVLDAKIVRIFRRRV